MNDYIFWITYSSNDNHIWGYGRTEKASLLKAECKHFYMRGFYHNCKFITIPAKNEVREAIVKCNSLSSIRWHIFDNIAELGVFKCSK